jgi:hypothetical protein
MTMLFGVALPLVITPLMILGGGWEAVLPAVSLHLFTGVPSFIGAYVHQLLGVKYGKK